MNKISILWKIYYWSVLICVIGMVAMAIFGDEVFFVGNIFSKIYDFTFVIIFMISIMGLRGYIYQKRYFSKDIWIFIFSLILIDFIGNLIYGFKSILLFPLSYVLLYSTIIFLLVLPFYYALYKYTFKMNEMWSIEND